MSDTIGVPCSCLECQAAGVTHLPCVKVPGDELVSVPHWLHGEALGRWWSARAQFLNLRNEPDRQSER